MVCLPVLVLVVRMAGVLVGGPHTLRAIPIAINKQISKRTQRGVDPL